MISTAQSKCNGTTEISVTSGSIDAFITELNAKDGLRASYNDSLSILTITNVSGPDADKNIQVHVYSATNTSGSSSILS